MNNIFEKFGDIKARINEIGNIAVQEGFISETEKKEMFEGLDKEKITIGVVGQVNCGKSTLLNAMIFGKDCLPMSPTPMTSSLTFLQYGDESIEVEFYNKEEWDEIQKKAQEESNETEIKVAKELVEKSQRIKNEIPSLLGRKSKVPLKNMEDYVGANGKYVPLTKSVTILLPSPKLKETNIIDTPGFNDPVASREARAQDSLRKADVVLVLLYSGRPFDESDRDIIFKKIRSVGTAKIVVIANKYDVVFQKPETLDKVMEYIKREWEKEVNKIEEVDETMAKIFRQTTPIPCSALAALLGRMKKEEIESSSVFKEYYHKYSEKSPFLKTQQDFVNFSKIEEVEKKIEGIIKNEKIKIIVRKPLLSIRAKMKEKEVDIKNKIDKTELEQKHLQKSFQEVNLEKKKFEYFKKEVIDIIEEKLRELEEEIKKKRNEQKVKIRNYMSELLLEIGNKFPEKILIESQSGYKKKCQKELSDCLIHFQNKIVESFEPYRKDTHEILKQTTSEIDCEVEKIIGEHLSYSSETVRNLKRDFLALLDVETNANFDIQQINLLDKNDNNWWQIFIIPSLIWRLLNVGDEKADLVEIARKKIKENLPFEKIAEPVDKIYQKVIGYCSDIKETFEDKVINPIQQGFENAERNRANKEKRLTEIPKEIEQLNKELENYQRRIKAFELEMNQLLEGEI